MMSKEQTRKAKKLVAENKIRRVKSGVYKVEGQGDTYTVTFHPSGRVKSCTCPAGSIWGRGKLRKYGKHVCYHAGAVAMLRKA